MGSSIVLKLDADNDPQGGMDVHTKVSESNNSWLIECDVEGGAGGTRNWEYEAFGVSTPYDPEGWRICNVKSWDMM